MKTGRPNAARELGASGNWQSQFLVPGSPAEPWELTNIPHGALATFYSKAMEAYRDYYVYTPPAYDAKRARRYPCCTCTTERRRMRAAGPISVKRI